MRTITFAAAAIAMIGYAAPALAQVHSYESCEALAEQRRSGPQEDGSIANSSGTAWPARFLLPPQPSRQPPSTCWRPKVSATARRLQNSGPRRAGENIAISSRSAWRAASRADGSGTRWCVPCCVTVLYRSRLMLTLLAGEARRGASFFCWRHCERSEAIQRGASKTGLFRRPTSAFTRVLDTRRGRLTMTADDSIRWKALCSYDALSGRLSRM